MSESSEKRWHLDKRIPIALIITLALQTAAGIWWASSLSERVNTLERDSAKSAPNVERIVRLETRIEAVVEGIGEIKRLLRRESTP